MAFQEALGPTAVRPSARPRPADRVGGNVVRLALAASPKVPSDVVPRGSAPAVIGASERSRTAPLTGNCSLAPATGTIGLVRIVLDGMRPAPRPM